MPGVIQIENATFDAIYIIIWYVDMNKYIVSSSYEPAVFRAHEKFRWVAVERG